MSNPGVMNRREMIKRVTFAAAAVGAADMAQAAPRRALRIAHFTDIHVQPEKRAAEGMAAALRHAQEHARPDVILNGGDAVMDVFARDSARARELHALWRRIVRDESSTPFIHCIGNHDTWGWNRGKSGLKGDEPLYGKAYAQDLFELPGRFYHIDRDGWRLVVLDSTFPRGDGYTARLDDEQFEWLDATLRDAAAPVMIVSHIPILSASAYLDGENEKSGDWTVPGAWMHIDARRLKDLFQRHAGKVRLCLSGHIHLVDRVDYLGVSYLCNGAVSGAWWDGDYQECPPGYAVVDLFDDGSFDARYVPWGWKPA